MALQVAAASTAGTPTAEEFVVELDGRTTEWHELASEHGGRTHVVHCAAGMLTIRYQAALPLAVSEGEVATETASLVALRQSRYCPSDVLEGFAAAELDHLDEGPGLARAIGDWVFERIQYESGSSDRFDTAIDTLLAGRGVCRDLAHLTISLCRALGVPARLVSVYAPGMTPMDFHAVAEVAVAGRWEIVDATKLAPRQSLVRIATGRDAADTAFAMTIDGSAELRSSTVTAISDGALPTDDHREAMTLA